MTALLKIDQVGLTEGDIGRSRTDGLATGAPVTLTNTGSGATTTMRLLWVPPGDTTAIDSLEPTEEDPKIWTFTPTAGVYGSYLIELVINAGLFTQTTEQRVLVVRTPRRGLVIPALNERGDPSASVINPGTSELAVNNAADFPEPEFNSVRFAGWWRAIAELIAAVDALPRAQPMVRVSHYSENALAVTDYDTLDAALEATYPISFPNTAAYTIAPNIDSPSAGPVELRTVVTYHFRAVAGAGVILPEFLSTTVVVVDEGVRCGAITGGSLRLRRAVASGALELESIDGIDSTLAGSFVVSGDARFDRCSFGDTYSAEITVDGAIVELINCTFGASPTIVFSGGDPGVVRMDARSNYLFDAAGGSVTNGSIVVQALP